MSRKKRFTFKFITVEDRSAEIAMSMVKREIEKVLKKHGVVSDNLDEVLKKCLR